MSLKQGNFQNRFNEMFDSIDKKLSVEVCPNKGLNNEILAQLKPRFCSVVWRIKSDQEYMNNVENSSSLVTAGKLRQEGYRVVLHVPGKHFTKAQVLRILNAAKSLDVTGILAVQGDLPYPKDEEYCDFKHASDLVTFIKVNFGDYFCVGVAGYPEKHPQSKSLEDDVAMLNYKVEKGADFILTQGCFSSQCYLDFVNRCRSNGISLPILCGFFLPNISGHPRIKGITYPYEVGTPECHPYDEIVIETKGRLVELLNNSSVDGVHVFSLNDFELCKRIIFNTSVIE